MRKKDGHQSKPNGVQGIDRKRPYLPKNDETRRQGEKFPGRRSQARRSPSENFGAPIKQGTFVGQARYQRNLPDEIRGENQHGDKSKYL